MLKLKTGSNIGSDTVTRDPTWPDLVSSLLWNVAYFSRVLAGLNK